jgi:hypothetical protein
MEENVEYIDQEKGYSSSNSMESMALNQRDDRPRTTGTEESTTETGTPVQ